MADSSNAPVSTSPMRTLPELRRPMPAGSRPMMVIAVRLLPQPDSPTSASVSPRARSKDTSRTASCQAPSMRREVVSPRTDSAG